MKRRPIAICGVCGGHGAIFVRVPDSSVAPGYDARIFARAIGTTGTEYYYEKPCDGCAATGFIPPLCDLETNLERECDDRF